MRKLIYAVAVFSSLVLTSCSSEENVTANPESKIAPIQSAEIIAFQKAWVQQIKERNGQTEKTVSPEMAAKTQDQVTDAAKNLLLANGYSDADFQSKTNGNDAAIRSMALRVLAEKTKITSKN